MHAHASSRCTCTSVLKFLRWDDKKVPYIFISESWPGNSTASVMNKRCRRGSTTKEPAVGFRHATYLQLNKNTNKASAAVQPSASGKTIVQVHSRQAAAGPSCLLAVLDVFLGQLLPIKPVPPAEMLPDEADRHGSFVRIQLGHIEVICKWQSWCGLVACE